MEWTSWLKLKPSVVKPVKIKESESANVGGSFNNEIGGIQLVICRGKDAFSFRENSIVVTIPFERINKVGNKVGNKKPLNSRRQKIISEMRDNPNITTAELHNILGVSEIAVENNISFLRENGYIERVGSKKARYWKVS